MKYSIAAIAVLSIGVVNSDMTAQNTPLVAIDAVRATDEPWSDYHGKNTKFDKPDVTKTSPDKALGLFIKLRAQDHGGYLSLLCKWTRNGKRIGNVNEVEKKDFYMPGITVLTCEIAPDPIWQELGNYTVEVQIDGVVVVSRTIQVSN